MNPFKHIIVIGYGVITERVLSYVDDCANKYGYHITYIEHEIYPFNVAKKYAESNDIDYRVIEDKSNLTDYFLEQARKERVLIISASNNYLFPIKIVDNLNTRIINFHNALLPNLPGRNAPSWAIYENYLKTGITWHYVASGIDDGDIIIQKECFLTDDIKAYELVAMQMGLASEAFGEVFEDVLNETVKTKKQILEKKRRVYKSQEVPGGGTFNIDDNVDDIYRLLRAMDYGKVAIFSLPKTFYNGKAISIKRYKKMDVSDKCKANDKIYLPYGKDKLLMLKYEVENVKKNDEEKGESIGRESFERTIEN